MMLTTSSVIPLYFLGQDDRSEVQHDFLGHLIHWHWCQHHVMQTALLIASKQSLGQDGQNKVQHDVLVM